MTTISEVLNAFLEDDSIFPGYQATSEETACAFDHPRHTAPT
jgi:hypothetical protein